MARMRERTSEYFSPDDLNNAFNYFSARLLGLYD